MSTHETEGFKHGGVANLVTRVRACWCGELGAGGLRSRGA